MPVSKKIPSKKTRYVVMIPRTQIYGFEIEAKSAEEVCKKLQRRLRLNNDFEAPADAHPISSVWGDPQDVESEWLVSGGVHVIDPSGKLGYMWNGKEIVRKKLF